MVPPPLPLPYASIDEALQLGIIDKLGPPPTAKVEPTQKDEGTPIYYMHKLLEDGRLTKNQREQFLAKDRKGPYTGASLYNHHPSLKTHLQNFYERDRFIHRYNQIRSEWRNSYYPQAAAGIPTGHQGGNGNWNSGAIVPTNQGFNTQVVLGQGWGSGGGGGGSMININLPQPQYSHAPFSGMMAPMPPFQYQLHPHHYYSNNVSNAHNAAGVSNATSYGNDGISTFSDNATMAQKGNENDETITLSTTMQQRHAGTAAVSSSAAMAGGASSNHGNGGSSSRGESFSCSSSVQTASQAPAKQSITTSSLKRTGQSNGPAVPAALQRTNPQALPLRHRNASPSDNAAVHEAEHNNDDDYDFNDDNFSVASDNENGSVSSTKSYYKGLCAHLTEALNAKKEENKSIKQENKSIKQENKRLKKDIDDLKKENNDLKKEINDLKNCKPSSITYNDENNCNHRSLYHRKSHK